MRRRRPPRRTAARRVALPDHAVSRVARGSRGNDREAAGGPGQGGAATVRTRQSQVRVRRRLAIRMDSRGRLRGRTARAMAHAVQPPGQRDIPGRRAVQGPLEFARQPEPHGAGFRPPEPALEPRQLALTTLAIEIVVREVDPQVPGAVRPPGPPQPEPTGKGHGIQVIAAGIHVGQVSRVAMESHGAVHRPFLAGFHPQGHAGRGKGIQAVTAGG